LFIAIGAYKKFVVEYTENAKFDEAMKSVDRCKEKDEVTEIIPALTGCTIYSYKAYLCALN